jgi:hypothetical protein
VVKRICDICGEKEITWFYRKKFSIWKHWYDMKENLDICDACIEDFKVYVKEAKERRAYDNKDI